ncbi:hypothetical protein METBIDRAFT_13485 [Metschnikowia bicuspidata var. bicuspidata NRRL YB-4993]|uniref:PCI domain-containing protein n=1 Tax=Metschnikowia bicuspidata var. bicuspidata NRRL YB-4993 TaxID=869754 RepID=A0A1A0H523_9ASCO|nr:hypothetical protein METBIDRAFT_13485 [Metschnikowia bicuspidata var. bicuspidata NRRL YB-4993]OBA19174.1 hypothetical protein METBIDRAFT_13485 [Metschnikowia bicuspidata var. bicuspidata NRRL YB-4993]
MKNTHDLTPHLAFVEFHPLVHRFKNSTEQGHRADLALSCLKLMDRFKTIHPIHAELCLALRAQNHSMADKYGDAWASNIESAGQQELFMGDEYIGQAEKPAFFEKFVPQFQKLLIGCDFANLQNLLNKVSLLVHFMNQCSDLALFTENRHFEFLFYLIVAVLYGLLWFSLLAKQDGLVQQNEETSPSLTWAQISRKCESYNKSHEHFLDDLDDKHPEVIEKLHSEFTFCTLVRWYCAFAKFKEHRLTEFCEDFELLQNDMSVLETIKLQSEALICYGISSIAAKPFKELDFQLNEQVLELFTSNTLVEASLYEVMKNLSMAKFTKAKDLWEPQLLNRLDSWVSYALPGKTKGTFWEFLREDAS